MNKLILFTALSLSAPLHAEDITYNWLELGYRYDKLDNLNVSTVFLDVSVEFSEQFYFLACGALSEPNGGNDNTVRLLGVGLGFHTPVGDAGMDFYSELGIGRASRDSAFGDIDFDLYDLTLGTRKFVSSNIELISALNYSVADTEQSSSDDQLSLGLGGVYYFADPSQAVRLHLDVNDDGDPGVELAFRYNF